ncbi:MAG: peptidoglycan DD-metalloendopeptidase family protein [Prevotellaceae bacterium]|jgi:murein DD-endopeptidase MepM/ murein hydrolase activator NlpD|nr:peptidoglycan DD-metalloendopeptidase family protein [Prevotellaceae bacterium]
MEKNRRKKERYFFNPESLDYESVGKSVTRTAKRALSILFFSFLVAVGYYAVYSIFFDTPAERAKKNENEILAKHLAEIEARYEQLDKVITDISKRDTNIYRVIFEANPPEVNKIDVSGLYKATANKSLGELISESKKKLTNNSAYSGKQKFLLDSLRSLMEKKNEELRFIPSIQPVKNPALKAAGASIGEKINPFYKSLRMHTGLDFAVPVGAEVMATADGTVNEIWYSQSGAGNRIVINHGNGYETRYLYLDEILVKKKAKVIRGQIIGKVGNLGMTVPHLHYEVRRDGKIADPLNYFFMELTPEQYEQITTISLNNGQSLD